MSKSQTPIVLTVSPELIEAEVDRQEATLRALLDPTGPHAGVLEGLLAMTGEAYTEKVKELFAANALRSIKAGREMAQALRKEVAAIEQSRREPEPEPCGFAERPDDDGEGL